MQDAPESWKRDTPLYPRPEVGARMEGRCHEVDPGSIPDGHQCPARFSFTGHGSFNDQYRCSALGKMLGLNENGQLSKLIYLSTLTHCQLPRYRIG